MNGKNLKDVVAECYKKLGDERTVDIVDNIKNLGFRYATHSGITMSIHDVKVPPRKAELLRQAEDNVDADRAAVPDGQPDRRGALLRRRSPSGPRRPNRSPRRSSTTSRTTARST